MTWLFAIVISTAHAGWFSNLCSHLVADDPYEFETAPLTWVTSQVEQLCIRKRWRVLDTDDQSRLDRMLVELQRRAAYGPEAEREAADLALIRCAQ